MHLFCNQHRCKCQFKNPSGIQSEYDFDYQPSKIDTDLKTLFGVFKSNGLKYSLRDFEKWRFLANLYSRWKKKLPKSTGIAILLPMPTIREVPNAAGMPGTSTVGPNRKIHKSPSPSPPRQYLLMCLLTLKK